MLGIVLQSMNKHIIILSVFVVCLCALCSCKPFIPETPQEKTPFVFKIPPFFPSQTYVSDLNMSVEGIDLGRYLFYDTRLSGRSLDETEGFMSCSSCHKQEYGFEAGADYKANTPHSMLPLCNLAFIPKNYLWNGSISSLEKLIYNTIIDTNEINANPDSVVAIISGISFYPQMFESAFGSPEISIDKICNALAQFVATLVSSDSKFDKYIRGEAELTDDELKGYILFTTEEGADCFHCHGGSGNMLFSTYQYANNGLDVVENMNDALDRSFVTGKGSDKGSYRIPTLRNIEYTAPYMHDGRFKTIEDVIDQYSEGVQYSTLISPLMHHVNENGVQLTADEKRCLKAFLLTLSDPDFISNPSFSKPKDQRLP